MARRAEIDDFRFDGFEGPNTTPVPDVLFDRLLARLGEAELKALLYIIRRTYGFKKSSDPISFNQFLRGITTHDGKSLDEGCGVRDRTSLSKALKSLEAKGIVLSEKGTDERGENTTTVYRLRFKDESQAADAELPQGVVGNPYHPEGVVGNAHHRGMNSRPPVVGNAHPQDTVKQQTARQETDLSNIRRATVKKEDQQPTRSRMGNPSAGGSSGREQRDASPAGMTTLAEEIARRQHRGSETQPPTADPAKREDRIQEAGARRRPRVVRPRLVPQQDEVYQVIQAYIADFGRELNDRAPLKTSTTRAYHLYQRAGIDQSAFIAQLYAARAIVKERTAMIRTRGEDSAAGFPLKHKAAYFFAVLEDLLGLRDPQAEVPQVAGAGDDARMHPVVARARERSGR